MRLRAPPALLLASLAACAIHPTMASAAEFTRCPTQRRRASPPRGRASSARPGLQHLHEGHLDAGSADGEHAEIQVARTKAEVAKLKQAGGETVTALELDAAVAKDPALGDSPNEFFNVYRQYSEPGGIADEMRKIAPEENPDVFKLEQDRHLDARQADPRAEDDRERAQREGRHA